MTRILPILLICLSISGCNKKLFISKGHFSFYNILDFDKTFITTDSVISNHIKKLPYNQLNYYAWKTVKYNLLDTFDNSNNKNKNDSSKYFIPSYFTLTDSMIEKLKPEQTSYIRAEGNLLINYLFFIDDYRCIYLSKDDSRSSNDFSDIDLYFDKHRYRLPKKEKKIYKQMLRGYYVIRGKEIFIDFERNGHIYIKGVADSSVITFTQISQSLSKTLYNTGLNTIYTNFCDVMNPSSLPVFESPKENNRLYNPKYLSLRFGFHYSTKPHKSMHEEMAKMKINTEESIIDSILYVRSDTASKYPNKRIYYFHNIKDTVIGRDTILIKDLHIVTENLGIKNDDAKNMIETW